MQRRPPGVPLNDGRSRCIRCGADLTTGGCPNQHRHDAADVGAKVVPALLVDPDDDALVEDFMARTRPKQSLKPFPDGGTPTITPEKAEELAQEGQQLRREYAPRRRAMQGPYDGGATAPLSAREEELRQEVRALGDEVERLRQVQSLWSEACDAMHAFVASRRIDAPPGETVFASVRNAYDRAKREAFEEAARVAGEVEQGRRWATSIADVIRGGAEEGTE